MKINREGKVRLYNCVKGLAHLPLKHLCFAHRKLRIADGWTVRANGFWTAADSTMGKCADCPRAP